MKNIWVPIAAVFMIVGTIFLIQLKFEAAFIVTALGAVAWFLNQRGQVKARLRDRFHDQNFDDGRNNDEDSPDSLT